MLSNGHGSMLLYSLLYPTGYEKLTLDDIRSFRELGSHCEGHPEIDSACGIETTTGPLGQGIANAAGMAPRLGPPYRAPMAASAPPGPRRICGRISGSRPTAWSRR